VVSGLDLDHSLLALFEDLTPTEDSRERQKKKKNTHIRTKVYLPTFLMLLQNSPSLRKYEFFLRRNNGHILNESNNLKF